MVREGRVMHHPNTNNTFMSYLIADFLCVYPPCSFRIGLMCWCECQGTRGRSNSAVGTTRSGDDNGKHERHTRLDIFVNSNPWMLRPGCVLHRSNRTPMKDQYLCFCDIPISLRDRLRPPPPLLAAANSSSGFGRRSTTCHRSAGFEYVLGTIF